ncbi:unnamed protein product [Arctogadus glacialis]
MGPLLPAWGRTGALLPPWGRTRALVPPWGRTGALVPPWGRPQGGTRAPVPPWGRPRPSSHPGAGPGPPPTLGPAQALLPAWDRMIDGAETTCITAIKYKDAISRWVLGESRHDQKGCNEENRSEPRAHIEPGRQPVPLSPQSGPGSSRACLCRAACPGGAAPQRPSALTDSSRPAGPGETPSRAPPGLSPGHRPTSTHPPLLYPWMSALV